MSYSDEYADDLIVVNLEAASKKIRLGCNDAKEFCASKDGKMIFAIDYDKKDNKSFLKGFDTKLRTELISISIDSMAFSAIFLMITTFFILMIERLKIMLSFNYLIIISIFKIKLLWIKNITFLCNLTKKQANVSYGI